MNINSKKTERQYRCVFRQVTKESFRIVYNALSKHSGLISIRPKKIIRNYIIHSIISQIKNLQGKPDEYKDFFYYKRDCLCYSITVEHKRGKQVEYYIIVYALGKSSSDIEINIFAYKELPRKNSRIVSKVPEALDYD